MATQTRTMPVPTMMPARSSGSIISQLFRVFIQPRSFFSAMPTGSSWLLAALLVLAITGYAATTQMQPETQTVGGVLPITNFDPGAVQTLPGGETGDGETGGFFQNTSTAAGTSNESMLTMALLAGSVQILLWIGQAAVLSLVPMLGGHAPKFGKSLQIAVWASLPLGLMLVLRSLSFASGGEGGALGVSALLDQWDGFAALPELAQTVVTVFSANLTLFWLWSLVLLYFGARYALGGGRLAATLAITIWIVGSTVVTALAGGIPTQSVPRPVVNVVQNDNDTSDNNTSLPGGADTFSFGPAQGAMQIFGGDGGNGTFTVRPIPGGGAAPAFGSQAGGG